MGLYVHRNHLGLLGTGKNRVGYFPFHPPPACNGGAQWALLTYLRKLSGPQARPRLGCNIGTRPVPDTKVLIPGAILRIEVFPAEKQEQKRKQIAQSRGENLSGV